MSSLKTPNSYISEDEKNGSKQCYNQTPRAIYNSPIFRRGAVPSLTSDPEAFGYYLAQNPAPPPPPPFVAEPQNNPGPAKFPLDSRFHTSRLEYLQTLEMQPQLKKRLRLEYLQIMSRYELRNGLYCITLQEYIQLPFECRARFAFNFIAAL